VVPQSLLRNTEPALRAGWHPVGRAADFSTEPTVVDLLGQRWLLRLDAAGKPEAIGWDEHPPHGVRQAWGLVWIAPDRPVADLLAAPELGSGGFADAWLPVFDTTAAAGLYLDNQLDVSHFPFVHTGTFGSESDVLVPDYTIVPTSNGFTATVEHGFRNVHDPGVASGERPLDQVRRVAYTFALPMQLQLRIDHLQTGQRTVLLFGTQPRAEGATRLYLRVLRNDIPGHPGIAAASLAETVAFETRVVLEDLALQEKFDVPGLPLTPALEMPVRADRTGLELRRLLRELCAAGTDTGTASAAVAA
jgi:phenylpropionate dioxygenase-like ring-hydroxylating dioxygenase large terminal subunit